MHTIRFLEVYDDFIMSELEFVVSLSFNCSFAIRQLSSQWNGGGGGGGGYRKPKDNFILMNALQDRYRYSGNE